MMMMMKYLLLVLAAASWPSVSGAMETTTTTSVVDRSLAEKTSTLSAECGNAPLDLQETLVNATAVWLDAIASEYNLTTLDSFCITPHFTSSCSLNFTNLTQEVQWRAAGTAAGGGI